MLLRLTLALLITLVLAADLFGTCNVSNCNACECYGIPPETVVAMEADLCGHPCGFKGGCTIVMHPNDFLTYYPKTSCTLWREGVEDIQNEQCEWSSITNPLRPPTSTLMGITALISVRGAAMTTNCSTWLMSFGEATEHTFSAVIGPQIGSSAATGDIRGRRSPMAISTLSTEAAQG
jgi:hypothetical protein